VLALGLALAVPAVRAVFAMVTRPTPETAAFAVLRGEVADPSRRTVLVCGEPRCVPISNFYFAFRPPPNLTVLFAADFAAQPLPQQVTVRALVNRRRSAGARKADPDLDLTRAIEALGLRALTSQRGVRLYDATDGAVLWEALQAP
jgi:hypothetical protein